MIVSEEANDEVETQLVDRSEDVDHLVCVINVIKCEYRML